MTTWNSCWTRTNIKILSREPLYWLRRVATTHLTPSTHYMNLPQECEESTIACYSATREFSNMVVSKFPKTGEPPMQTPKYYHPFHRDRKMVPYTSESGKRPHKRIGCGFQGSLRTSHRPKALGPEFAAEPL